MKIATATVLIAATVVMALTSAASAAADDQTCTDGGGATRCQAVDNVQIVAKPMPLPSAGNSNSSYGPFVGLHNGRNGTSDPYGPFEGYHAGHH
jgi:archaellum component FlaG (FlaF/FlaG flagellin family)